MAFKVQLLKHVFLSLIPSCVGPWGPGSQSYSAAVTLALMRDLNASDISDLQSIHPSMLQWPHIYAIDVEFPGYWVDGWVTPQHPIILYADQNHTLNPKSFIVGGNSMDGVTPFVPYQTSPIIPTSQWEFITQLKLHWTNIFTHTIESNSNNISANIAKLYPLNDSKFSRSTKAAAAYVSADGDYNVNCPSIYLAEYALQRPNIDVYLYHFSHGPVCKMNPVANYPQIISTGGWANHGSEHAFVFGTKPACGYTEEELQLSFRMQKSWVSFATTGIPTGSIVYNKTIDPNMTSWRRYTKNEGSVIEFEVGNRLNIFNNFKKPQCEMWRQFKVLY